MEKFRKNIPVIVRVAAILMLVCYFIPFCTVSCEGEVLARMTPLEMTTGKEIEGEYVGGEATVCILIVLPVLALCFSFLKNMSAKSTLYILSGAGILVAINVFLVNGKNEASEFGCDFTPGVGYYLFFIYGLFMIVAGIISLMQRKVKEESSEELSEGKSTEG